MIDIGQIHIAEPFSEIFPVDNKTLRAIQENITHYGFDEAEPLIVWKRNGKLVCVDGHTRYMAAQALGLPQVPVIEKSFNTDDEAVEYAIHRQRDRRNLSDAELWKCMQWMDKRKERGGDQGRDGGKFQPKASNEANGKSAEKTAETLGISRAKVEKARTVMDHGDEETIQAIEQGEMSINKAYEETRKKKKEMNSGGVVDDIRTFQVSDALNFATLAISQLERIALDDPEREEAFVAVQNWIEKNKRRG
jgi:ParB-like chromosome segregation protein Spo0J